MRLRAKVDVLNRVPLDRLGHLIAESEEEGFSYLVRMRDEWLAGQVRFDGRGEAFFVAESQGEVLGVCGLTTDPHEGDETVGRVRKLYVRKAYRRRGIGRQLLRHLRSVASQHFRELRVRTRGPAGYAFYESLGFRETQRGASFTHCIELTRS